MGPSRNLLVVFGKAPNANLRGRNMSIIQKRAHFLVGSAALAAMLVVSAGADAATINLQTFAETYPANTNRDNQNTSTSTSPSQTSATQTSTVSNPGISASAATGAAQADIVTGELKASAMTSFVDSQGLNSTEAYAVANLYETFNVVGNGTIHAFFSVDGSYDISRSDGGSVDFQQEDRISLYAGAPNLSGNQSFSTLATSPGGVASSNVCPTGCSSVNGPIHDLLTFDYHLSTGQYTFQAEMLAQMIVGAGSVDLSHTGKLLISTEPDQPGSNFELNPVDPNFLSDPVYNVNATPLPAALPLFASGLGGLGFLGWRRRKRGAKMAA